jgi:pimeloyl-ACP methyl ester carboxylesterase
MDHAQILALIAALSGAPESAPFAGLRAEAQKPGSVVSIEACPRPLPPGEIEGVSLSCGRVKVPEDRSKPGGKMLPLAFAIYKSTSRYPEPDPLVYLQGGPGGSAFEILSKLQTAFRPWRDRRDLVIYDQRSAGISGSSVNCAEALSQNLVEIARPGSKANIDGIAAPDLMKTCVAELDKQGVPLALYNTTENALDLPLIVRALGYSDYNIYGISYGTKLALEVMRSAPKGIRSVIIDGVAPPWLNLYNSQSQKMDEAIQHVVDQCAEDKVCDKAYPDLGRIFIETMNKTAKGEVLFRGEKLSVEIALSPVLARNGNANSVPVTRFIPAYIYELWRGKEMPTVEMLTAADFKTPRDDAMVLKASTDLNAEQKALVQQMLDNAAIATRANEGSARAEAALRDATEAARDFGPLARQFDQELAAAMQDVARADKAKLNAALTDYAALRLQKPEKAGLQAFVAKHFNGPTKDRLAALITAMTTPEVEGSFAIVRRDSYKALAPFLSGLYLDVYACQEDVPFNSFEGHQAVTAKLRYPHIGTFTDNTTRRFFEGCAALKPHPRENWHVPVKSAIPTLSFGGLYDTQTSASWAKAAIEKMSNAQAFLIPEAGHGAVLYQPCVAQMGVAFTDNPKRKFDNSCAHSIKVDWYIALWVSAQKE